MSFKIKKIYQVKNTKYKLYPMDIPGIGGASGATGPNEPGTASTEIPQQNGYPTSIINWWVKDLAIKGNAGQLSYNREICGFVPPWPKIPYVTNNGTKMAVFSYVCWNGSNYTTSDDPSACYCNNGQPGDLYGLCPTNQLPPVTDKNGGAQSSPFYPTGSIVINQPGQYIVLLVLDGYRPACDPNYIPNLYINSYRSIDEMTTHSNTPGVPVTPNKKLGDNYTRVWTKTPISVTYDSYTFNLWWPVKQTSTIAPIPYPPPESGSDTSTGYLNGLFTLEQGQVLQFVIENTCGGSSNQIGTFTGTIQITPQFPTTTT